MLALVSRKPILRGFPRITVARLHVYSSVRTHLPRHSAGLHPTTPHAWFRRPCTAARSLSTTSPRHAPEYMESSPDPSRTDLHYHLTTLSHSPEPVYALSLLSSLPGGLSQDSPAVIGYLPAVADEGGEAGLNDFAENRALSCGLSNCRVLIFCHNIGRFRDALHEAVQAVLEDGSDDILMSAAMQTGEGWMHINGLSTFVFREHLYSSFTDERNLPPMGRISDPEDIIGSVRVEGGKVCTLSTLR
jgi:hypothetical protein